MVEAFLLSEHEDRIKALPAIHGDLQPLEVFKQVAACYGKAFPYQHFDREFFDALEAYFTELWSNFPNEASLPTANIPQALRDIFQIMLDIVNRGSLKKLPDFSSFFTVPSRTSLSVRDYLENMQPVLEAINYALAHRGVRIDSRSLQAMDISDSDLEIVTLSEAIDILPDKKNYSEYANLYKQFTGCMARLEILEVDDIKIAIPARGLIKLEERKYFTLLTDLITKQLSVLKNIPSPHPSRAIRAAQTEVHNQALAAAA